MSAAIDVLHVDDDPSVLDLAEAYFERELDSVAVTSETDPEAALELLADDTFDCVVSDYDMPPMDGLEFFEALRERNQKIPFVLYTGKGSEEIASQALNAGVTGYFQKGGPEQLRRLANRVDQAVDEYRTKEIAERYSTVIEALGYPVYVVDGTGVFRFVNEPFAELTGYDREEIIGQTPGFIKDDAAVQEAEDRLGTILSDSGPDVQHFGVDIVPKEGDPIPCRDHMAALPYDGECFEGSVGILRDVSDERERREELETKTRALDEAPVGITITDPQQDDNPMVYVNDRFVEMTGYDREESIGVNCRFLQGPDTEEASVQQLRDAIDADEPTSVELLNYRKDGTEFWNRVSIAPISDADGTVTHWVGFQEDITAFKERARGGARTAERPARLLRQHRLARPAEPAERRAGARRTGARGLGRRGEPRRRPRRARPHGVDRRAHPRARPRGRDGRRPGTRRPRGGRRRQLVDRRHRVGGPLRRDRARGARRPGPASEPLREPHAERGRARRLRRLDPRRRALGRLLRRGRRAGDRPRRGRLPLRTRRERRGGDHRVRPRDRSGDSHRARLVRRGDDRRGRRRAVRGPRRRQADSGGPLSRAPGTPPSLRQEADRLPPFTRTFIVRSERRANGTALRRHRHRPARDRAGARADGRCRRELLPHRRPPAVRLQRPRRHRGAARRGDRGRRGRGHAHRTAAHRDRPLAFRVPQQPLATVHGTAVGPCRRSPAVRPRRNPPPRYRERPVHDRDELPGPRRTARDPGARRGAHHPRDGRAGQRVRRERRRPRRQLRRVQHVPTHRVRLRPDPRGRGRRGGPVRPLARRIAGPRRVRRRLRRGLCGGVPQLRAGVPARPGRRCRGRGGRRRVDPGPRRGPPARPGVHARARHRHDGRVYRAVRDAPEPGERPAGPGPDLVRRAVRGRDDRERDLPGPGGPRQRPDRSPAVPARRVRPPRPDDAASGDRDGAGADDARPARAGGRGRVRVRAVARARRRPRPRGRVGDHAVGAHDGVRVRGRPGAAGVRLARRLRLRRPLRGRGRRRRARAGRGVHAGRGDAERRRRAGRRGGRGLTRPGHPRAAAIGLWRCSGRRRAGSLALINGPNSPH
ncbi:HTR-like protein [Halorubrum tebenquichense DSM 14210]|uniref:HTR-like protein n=1 Tax=Halorubrum tebenquichense DSM 14210 TaxID=1227485 RepID=M0DVK1_9EURY|nr:HTR-like protein [Halorubrum tebenquichense DSM 14210]